MIEDEYGNRVKEVCPECKGQVIAYRDVGGAIFQGQCVRCLAYVETEGAKEYRERCAMARGLSSDATWKRIREVGK